MSATLLTTQDAFLEDIRERPDDDAPRLIYADWLDDEGQAERAEFIRVQIALVGMEGAEQHNGRPTGYFCKRTGTWTAWHKWAKRCRCGLCSLRRREYQTSKRWCNWEWREGIPHPAVVTFRRGFVESIRCPLDAWLVHGKAVVGAHPVTALQITDREPTTFSDVPAVWERGMSDLPLEEPWSGYVCGADSRIPGAIFDVMIASGRGEPGGYAFMLGKYTDCRFASTELATEVLNAAALHWAQKEAGLV